MLNESSKTVEVEGELEEDVPYGEGVTHLPFCPCGIHGTRQGCDINNGQQAHETLKKTTQSQFSENRKVIGMNQKYRSLLA